MQSKGMYEFGNLRVNYGTTKISKKMTAQSGVPEAFQGRGGRITQKGHPGQRERIAAIVRKTHFAMFCNYLFNISVIKT